MTSINEKVDQLIENAKKNKNVYIKDVDSLKEKLTKMLNDKTDSLQVISDFDMTITQYWKDGKRTPTSYFIISESPFVSKEFREKSEALVKKYYPYEIATDISFEEKYKLMDEWWSKEHQLIVEQQLTKSSLATLVKESPVVFREGFKDLFELCKKKNVPFMISSAGIKNVIEEVFTQANLSYDKFIVRSNGMIFSPETEICVGFKEPIIHSLNKNKLGLIEPKYHDIIKDRKNVILFGDSVGDIDMVKAVQYNQCISFGFLNIEKEISLDKYMNLFDVVITDDGSFDFANEILQTIN